MDIREAKDFLIDQTAQQAAIENIPLSDLEKRMMYFTESGEMPENPISLKEAFEAECDSNEYELKISKLMRHAFWRVKKGESAIRGPMEEGDQEALYGRPLFVRIVERRLEGTSAPYDSLKLIGAGVLVAVIGTNTPAD